jgi:SAM-dependent methyltransferase
MGDLKFAPRWPANYATVRFVYQARDILALGGTGVSVLDLGSGNGMFAAMLWHMGHRGIYRGLDFSAGAVEVSIVGNRDKGGHQNAEFELCDLEEADVAGLMADHFADHDDVLLTSGETLEHMRNDRRLIATVPLGTRCVITVPRFGGAAHVRWWLLREQLEAYWAPFFTPESWKHGWVPTPRREPGDWCHSFSGVRNDAGRHEWPPTFGCPPLTAEEHAARTELMENDGEYGFRQRRRLED